MRSLKLRTIYTTFTPTVQTDVSCRHNQATRQWLKMEDLVPKSVQMVQFPHILARGFTMPCNQGSVYTGPDSFGTGTKLVRISLVFTRDLVDPAQIGLLCGTKWVHL